MKSNYDIPEDSFIPEGLEFREEYLQDALSMYDRAKRKAVWYRRSLLASLLLVIGSSVVLWVNYEKQNVGTVALLAAKQKENVEVRNSSKRISQENIDESESLSTKAQMDSQRITEKTKEKTIIYTQSEKKNAVNAKAEDQGGSLGSGNGLPDLMPKSNSNSKQILNDKSLSNATAFISPKELWNSNSVSTNEGVQQNENLVSESLLSTEVSSEVSEKNYSRINYIDHKSFEHSFSPDLSFSNSIKNLPAKKFRPYLVIGVSPLSGFGSDRLELKPDAYLALGLNYRLGNSWRVAGDARYYFVSGLSHPLTFTETTYGQGFETNSTTIHTNRLHYAGIQFALQKQFTKHQLSFGYAIDYLITGQNSIENKSNSSFEDIVTHNDKSNGYVLGFKNFNHSVSIGYDYWFGKNKAIGMAYQFGLTDITRNEYFIKSEFDRNSMLTARLKMYLR